MTSAPVALAPDVAPLSEPARILDTFIAPGKTFADTRRSAAWWGPFLIAVIFSIAFTYAIDVKVGFRKVIDNQVERSPKASQRLDQLPREDRNAQLNAQAKGTRYFMYGLPIFLLLWNLIIAALLFGTFKLALAADLTFSGTYAVVWYAGLVVNIRTILAIIMLFAGLDPGAFNLQNSAPTNPGYFMDPGSSPFLYSVATSIDLFMIWTLLLTAHGLSILAKKKLSTAIIVVFFWYGLFVFGSAGIAAFFS